MPNLYNYFLLQQLYIKKLTPDMKNSIKAIVIALAVVSLGACKGKGSASTDSVKTDSVVKTSTDTIKKDTSLMPDSLKKDTMIKSTTTKVTSKTSVTKKP